MSTLLGTICLRFPFFSSEGRLWHHANESAGNGARWAERKKKRERTLRGRKWSTRKRDTNPLVTNNQGNCEMCVKWEQDHKRERRKTGSSGDVEFSCLVAFSTTCLSLTMWSAHFLFVCLVRHWWQITVIKVQMVCLWEIQKETRQTNNRAGVRKKVIMVRSRKTAEISLGREHLCRKIKVCLEGNLKLLQNYFQVKQMYEKSINTCIPIYVSVWFHEKLVLIFRHVTLPSQNHIKTNHNSHIHL